jgi:hypothetical protein
MNLKATNHLRWLTALRNIGFSLLLVITLVGCATGPSVKYVDHGFAFNVWQDSPGIQVLAYSYGNSKVPYYNNRLGATEKDTKDGQTQQSSNISGEIPLGQYLFVKWRNKATGEVFEDTVDLQAVWPHSLKRWDIYFILEGRQLYVYLISKSYEKPYFTFDEGQQIDDFKISSPRQRTLGAFARRNITMIYPERQLDPHLPQNLRRKR